MSFTISANSVALALTLTGFPALASLEAVANNDVAMPQCALKGIQVHFKGSSGKPASFRMADT